MQENTIINNTGTKRHCLNNVRNILWASHWNTSRFKCWNQLICSNWQYAELIAVKMYYNNIVQTFSRTFEALIKHFKDYSNTTFHSFKKKESTTSNPLPFRIPAHKWKSSRKEQTTTNNYRSAVNCIRLASLLDCTNFITECPKFGKLSYKWHLDIFSVSLKIWRVFRALKMAFWYWRALKSATNHECCQGM